MILAVSLIAVACALAACFAASLARDAVRRAHRDATEALRLLEREREAFTAERSDYALERANLLDRLGSALNKPWGPPPMIERRPEPEPDFDGEGAGDQLLHA